MFDLSIRRKIKKECEQNEASKLRNAFYIKTKILLVINQRFISDVQLPISVDR